MAAFIVTAAKPGAPVTQFPFANQLLTAVSTVAADRTVNCSGQPGQPFMWKNRTVVSVALLLFGYGLLYRHVVTKLVADWSSDGNYSHGFLIVPLAAYLAWERRMRMAEAQSHPAITGLAVVIASLALLMIGI